MTYILYDVKIIQMFFWCLHARFGAVSSTDKGSARFTRMVASLSGRGGVNVRRATIVDFENCEHEPHHATLTILMNELAAAGIAFTEKGVEFRKWPPAPYVPTGV